VAATVGLAPPQQRLILKGKVLVDDKTMQESGNERLCACAYLWC